MNVILEPWLEIVQSSLSLARALLVFWLLLEGSFHELHRNLTADLSKSQISCSNKIDYQDLGLLGY